MNKTKAFQDFLATQSAHIPVLGFLLNLFLAGLLAHLLGRLYIRYGGSLSNRRQFASNFLLTTMTTMLVISIVKSSLALSLGMVGALSIVRFRAAIKEPEELSYLFLAIGIGLGFGADQRMITLAAFAAISATVMLRRNPALTERSQNLHLTVSGKKGHKVDLDGVAAILQKHCPTVSLRRLDETPDRLEAAFFVEFADFARFTQARAKLCALDDSVRVTFLDNTGIA